MRRLGIVVVGLALLLVFASACGDGDETRQEEARSYVQSLCTKELVDWYVLGAEVAEDPPETLDEVVDTFNLIEDEANRFYDHVASIDPPKEMEEWHTSVLAGLQDASSIGRDLEAAVASGNENELAAVGKRAERLLETFGTVTEMDVPAEYVEAWEEDCFPKIKERLPEAELD